ncbi:MAG: GNAT family N-acetyltransferase [Anaerolineales bacterium]|nr:GNAT family N-acetyltransferase [Anaerolineales bacterium]
MSETIIRQVQGDEMLEILPRLTAYAFQPTPPWPDEEERKQTLKNRGGVTYLALFEDGKPAACVATTRMTQHVRAARYGMGGVWAVATHPAARRKGFCKRLMTRLMENMRQDGLALTCLYPFRESFYERLGYITFPLQRKALFKPSGLAAVFDMRLYGEVELSLFGEAYPAYRQYCYNLLERCHGVAIFDEPEQVNSQKVNQWLALARIDGQVIGLMEYQLKGEQVTQLELRAIRFYYDDVRGRYLLLDWIARHVDQAEQVEVWLPPFEWPETWLADMQVKVGTASRAPMGRVLDVARLGGMQVGQGRFSFQLSDPQCPWNQGAWEFQALDGVLHVRPAKRADCNLGIQGLSALVYGAHDPAGFALRGWGDPTPELQALLRGMFPPKLAFIHEFF